MATFRLKLLVDTKQKKVLFAEAGKDFVDFLFTTLLSYPAKTMMKLLSMDPMDGSLRKLIDSVERYGFLNNHMIMIPEEELVEVEVKKLERKKIYVCSNHYYNKTPYCSDDPKTKCPQCCSYLNVPATYVAPPKINTTPGEASSAPKKREFVIMDDLKIEMKPEMSLATTITMLGKLNVKDCGALEVKVVCLGKDDGVKLIKESLQSKSVLTNVFLGGVSGPGNQEDQSQQCFFYKEPERQSARYNIIKFAFDSKTGKVIFAEVDSKLLDILYGFLGFPISSLGAMGVGAMPILCSSLANLESFALQPGFNPQEFFKMKPQFPGPHNSFIPCPSGESSSIQFKNTKYYVCKLCTLEFSQAPSYVTMDPKTKCGTCRRVMDMELFYAPNGADDDYQWIVSPERKYILSDRMKLIQCDSLLKIQSMVTPYLDLMWLDLTPTHEMIVSLLKRCVDGGDKNVLTDVFAAHLKGKEGMKL